MRLPAPPGAGVWAGRAAASVPGAGPSSLLPHWEINCVGWQGVLVPPQCHPWGWGGGEFKGWGRSVWERGWWKGTACGCGVPPCCKWVPAAGLWLLWVRVRGDVTARSLLGVLPLTASPWSCSSGHVLSTKPLAGSCPCPFPHLWAILAKPGPIRGCRMVGPRRRLSRGFPHPLDMVPSGPSPSLALFQFPDTSRCLILLRARGLCRKGTAPVEERQIK